MAVGGPDSLEQLEAMKKNQDNSHVLKLAFQHAVQTVGNKLQ